MRAHARRSQGRQRAMPLRGWPQRLLHAAALLAGWALFILGWHKVLGQPWETRTLWLLILGSLLLLPALTAAWILHNLGIHRRKGPRSGVPKAAEAYVRDWNGREVAADWNALAQAPLVVIDHEGERKVFRAAAASAWTASAKPPAGRSARIDPPEGPSTEAATEGGAP